jgi:autoinducer 2-degrading protein
MFTVVVDFSIKSGFEEQFQAAVLMQAENSLSLEKDCHKFDVCKDPKRSGKFLLYELYTDDLAFDLHLKSQHFLDFDKLVSPWIETKTVQILTLLKT